MSPRITKGLAGRVREFLVRTNREKLKAQPREVLRIKQRISSQKKLQEGPRTWW